MFTDTLFFYEIPRVLGQNTLLPTPVHPRQSLQFVGIKDSHPIPVLWETLPHPPTFLRENTIAPAFFMKLPVWVKMKNKRPMGLKFDAKKQH